MINWLYIEKVLLIALSLLLLLNTSSSNNKCTKVLPVVKCEEEKYPTQFIPAIQTSSSLSWTNITTYKDTNLHRNVYVIQTTNLWSVIAPILDSTHPKSNTNYASILRRANTTKNKYNTNAIQITTNPFQPIQNDVTKKKKKWKLQRTSIQSKKNNCSIGINGGPYNADGTFVATVIMNGTVYTKDYNSNYIGFGITKPIKIDEDQEEQQQYWMIGKIGTGTIIDPTNILHYVTGFDWLVYNGTNVVDDNNPDVYNGVLQAPRTTIGVTKNGILLVIVFDGCERWIRYRGPTLHYIASTLIHHGALYAINMDGGASTTLVTKRTRSSKSTKPPKYKLFNQPTCIDYIPLICERPIATVMCIQ